MHAKHRACLRAFRSGPVGLAPEDLMDAIQKVLSGIVGRLRPGPALYQTLDLPTDRDVVRVDAHCNGALPRTHEYLRYR